MRKNCCVAHLVFKSCDGSSRKQTIILVITACNSAHSLYITWGFLDLLSFLWSFLDLLFQKRVYIDLFWVFVFITETQNHTESFMLEKTSWIVKSNQLLADHHLVN